ncbi:hypothetical protein F4820DRAFT_442313 [Hypoxylon rubiginosum]|uniref:Uncharacterized protein n=1 Tax=Hypoxylon rubiginosum TaxID=110542 RepID=A0ACB9YGD2_9PEZI|nr:hypothetical protein F4820DRAFT_442313 [Hypoxylon rubiginosum]
MPRPTRRTRVASTRITTKAGSPTAAAPIPALVHAASSEEQQQADEASSDIYDVSDREKEKAKQKRDSMRDARSTSRPRPVSKQQTKALETARQRRDLAMERLENITSTSSNQASELIERSDDSIELGRKVAGTPQPKRITDVSGLDLDDDMFDDLNNTTFDTAGPASAQRSADTSSISASIFKQRPRAASFLSREDGYIRPSSRAGPTTPGFSSNFNIGVFKKRAREPSILGTAQKPRPQRAEPEPELDSEPENEDDEVAEGEDGFAPEAESTPLKRSKRRSEEIEVDRTPPASTSANPRKRKSSEGHEHRSRSSPFELNGLIDDAVVPQTQTESDLSSPPSTPPRRAQSSRPATPVMDEELLAPPLSSSPSAENEEIWPPLQSLARGRLRRPASVLRRTPVPNDNVSDMSSPPSLTYSPNYREPSPPLKRSKRRPASKQEAKKVTTADLAGLLPRRRRRNAGVEEDSDAEVDMSGLGDDDDELSHLDVRARRHPARPTSRAGNSRNQNATRGRPTSRGKGKQQVSDSANRRATITYGRTSDKENQGEDDDEEGDEADEGDDSLGRDGDGQGEESSQDMLARMGEELKNAARKFQEVDKWQLDYEEMTQSSSPRDAR